MRHWRWHSKVLFGLAVLAFAYFVWPTPWMYFGNGVGGQGGTIVRVNRITGTPYMLYGRDGWQRMEPERVSDMDRARKRAQESGRTVEEELRKIELDTLLARIRAEESGRTVEEELADIRR